MITSLRCVWKGCCDYKGTTLSMRIAISSSCASQQGYHSMEQAVPPIGNSSWVRMG